MRGGARGNLGRGRGSFRGAQISGEVIEGTTSGDFENQGSRGRGSYRGVYRGDRGGHRGS